MNNPRYAILAVLIIALIVGGWVYLSPQGGALPKMGDQKQPVTTQKPGQVNDPTRKNFALVVQQRKLVAGESTLTVNKGDVVTITITADENDELHLHGYDLSTDFKKGVPVMLTFTASKSGRFPFEMEHSKTELGELDVKP